MALSNSQYESIMRVYNRTQLQKKHELDARVDEATERIQLAHQVALRASADIRVARHQGDAVHADGKHDRLESQSRACQRRLTAGVSRPDDRYIIIFC